MGSGGETLRLLEAAHRFPCRFSFKVIGDHSDSFALLAGAAIADVVGTAAPPRVKSSASGRHVALTFAAQVDSATQVLLVFAALRSVPGVRLVL